MPYQLQTAIGETLPISLVLLTDGQRGAVVFIKTRQFATIIDLSEKDGKHTICAIFDMDGFKIGDEEYDYNHAYEYKEIPEMLEWLERQGMVLPQIV
jgi:hypothetical protein